MSKKAVLLLNLGSPDSTSIPDVRRYLREFLMDERVLACSYLQRWLVVNLFILPKRPANTAEAYGRIWTDEGSPLITTSRELGRLVEEDIDFPVDIAMRYGNPSTPDAIKKLKDEGVDEVFVIPLYPHYAMSSFETAVEWTKDSIKKYAPGLKATFMDPFYNHPEYIQALYETSKSYLGEFDKLLFSFHGLPESHLKMSDPTNEHCLKCENCCTTANATAHAKCYRHQCLETARLFAEKAGISSDKYFVSFQSRLGREPWLKPYTDKVLEEFPKQGVKKLLVMSAAFVSDNLETLEELGMEGKETFMEAGGESYQLIPCMNLDVAWVKFLQDRIREHYS